MIYDVLIIVVLLLFFVELLCEVYCCYDFKYVVDLVLLFVVSVMSISVLSDCLV